MQFKFQYGKQLEERFYSTVFRAVFESGYRRLLDAYLLRGLLLSKLQLAPGTFQGVSQHIRRSDFHIILHMR